MPSPEVVWLIEQTLLLAWITPMIQMIALSLKVQAKVGRQVANSVQIGQVQVKCALLQTKSQREK